MLPDKPENIAVGFSRLKYQRRGKRVIEGLLQSYLSPIQDISNEAEFYKNLSVMNATDGNLDLYGRLYGVPRNQRDDSNYRAAILGYIASTEPDASPEGIMEALRSYGQTDLVDLHEHFPCYTQAYMGEGFGADMYTVLKSLVSAGTDVGLYIDNRGDSIVLEEEDPVTQYFVTDEDKLLDLEVSPLNFNTLSLQTANGSTTESFNSTFAEELDTTWHPLAEQMDFGVEYQTGNIIDEFGNQIVDEYDNTIIYVDYRFKPR